MNKKTSELLIALEETLKVDDWSQGAHNAAESLIEMLNTREMTDEEYEQYSVLLRKF